jgi:lipoyl(octanoyl) transferase
VEYADAERMQEDLVEARRLGTVPDTLLLLEHPPVITLGRSADAGHVLISAEARAASGIALHETGRGGDVTYHGPGQLVGYPVVALGPGRRDVRAYLRDLEEALIRVLSDFGVRGERRDGLTGVWVGDRKAAAIGVRVSTGWITSHGFALNVTTDLRAFSSIVPCGIRGLGVTSLQEETGTPVPLRTVADAAASHLADVLGRSLGVAS